MGGRKRSVSVAAAAQEEPPYLAYFPSGFRPTERSASSAADATTFTVYENSEGPKRRRELVGHQNGVNYVGRAGANESGAPAPCSYMLGVYNKEKGELKISNIADGSICRVEVRAPKADYTASGMFGSATDVSRTIQNKRLVDAFGSTRRRRQLETAEGARVSSEQVGASEAVLGMVTAMAKDAVVSGQSKEQVLARVTGTRNIPKHHLSATSGDAAYKMSEIVPEGMRLEGGRLLSASEDSQVMDAMADKGFVHRYVVGRVPALLTPTEGASDKEKKARKHRAKALSFLSSLLNLHSASKFLKPKAAKGGIGALAKTARIPQDSMEPLMKAFYERSTGDNGEDVYLRSGPNSELLLSHICLAALLAEGCKMSKDQFEELRLVLQMTPADLLSRFRELGAKGTPVSLPRVPGRPLTRTYHVSLLQDGSTLKDSLPGIKLGRRAGS
mmetsp:Transcript_36614/g.95091  ORF Transcript_36614/g.95091 Transcript_36614/m.95091 type:complete len:445 (-) Transcript_36614:154-1488(-)